MSDLPSGLERRKEDYGLITGHARYVDDLKPGNGRPAALHMLVVRSPHAHAEIRGMQFEAARAVPGVVGVFAGSELVNAMPTFDSFPVPGLKKPERRPMAVGKVRYIGDPVAVVLAENLYAAADARDLVEVEYEPLPAVADPEAAIEPGAPLLYKDFGTNIAFVVKGGGGDIEAAFQHADRTVRLQLVNQRLAPSSIEPRACMFDFDPASGELSAWLSSQAIYRARDTLASFLGIEASRIRVHNAEVGGAFGAKTGFLGEEIVAAALAVKYGRPVKWIEGRSENLQAQIHGRGQVNYIEAAFKNDGQLLGLKVRTLADLGAFLNEVTAMVPTRSATFLSGAYQVQAVETQVIGVLTNKVPTAPYRGAGRPEATYIMERTMERIAHELGLDPAEVRRRNFIPPEAFPYKSIAGPVYDSGNYQAALDQALELSDYKKWREEQRQRRAANDPRLLGIGLSTFIELTGDGINPRPGTPREAATVRIRRDGTILVQSGVSHSGQGHFTTFAQIAASTFHLPGSQVEVRMNDTDLPGYSIATRGSRITQVAGSAVLLAAKAAREKALQVAAHVLEAAPSDLTLENGRVMVQGVPARTVELGELARMVEERPELIEREAPNPVNGVAIEGLAAWRDFAPSGPAYASGTHIAVVELDSETGETHILKYVAVDDCGHVLNHYLTEAQVHGSTAQGIGQALYEEVMYDRDGQLLSGTLLDYALPIASEVPEFITAAVETPSPTNPLGAKGVGEAGCIAAPPAVVNAVLDALAPLGIKSIDMPIRPEKVWALVQAARTGTLKQAEPVPPTLPG